MTMTPPAHLWLHLADLSGPPWEEVHPGPHGRFSARLAAACVLREARRLARGRPSLRPRTAISGKMWWVPLPEPCVLLLDA